jgi:hypothetical protein
MTKNLLVSKQKQEKKQSKSLCVNSVGMSSKKRKTRTPIYQYSDGGRWRAGFRDHTKDCVTRSIAMILEINYLTAYEKVNEFINSFEKKKVSSATIGIANKTTKKLFESLGLRWIPSNKIPNGKGRYILNMPNHVCYMKNGIVFDTHNYFEKTKRVYGYWKF